MDLGSLTVQGNHMRTIEMTDKGWQGKNRDRDDVMETAIWNGKTREEMGSFEKHIQQLAEKDNRKKQVREGVTPGKWLD